jgi:hypothetical protein
MRSKILNEPPEVSGYDSVNLRPRRQNKLSGQRLQSKSLARFVDVLTISILPSRRKHSSLESPQVCWDGTRISPITRAVTSTRGKRSSGAQRPAAAGCLAKPVAVPALNIPGDHLGIGPFGCVSRLRDPWRWPVPTERNVGQWHAATRSQTGRRRLATPRRHKVTQLL